MYIFLTLKFAAIQFCQRTFFQRNSEHQSPQNKLFIEGAIFSDQHREQPFEAATFLQKDFFKIPGCLEQLLFSNYYFLVTNIFSDQVLFECKYSFSTASVLEKLLLQNKYLFRTCTFLKQAFFYKNNLGAGIYRKHSLFLIVPRNQFYSIYT